jgi:hypothetical protein
MRIGGRPYPSSPSRVEQTVKVGFLALVLSIAMSACSTPSRPIATNPSPSSGVASASRSPSPNPVEDSPTPIAGDWVTFANSAGAFTYSVPAAWEAASCEDGGKGYVVAPGTCGVGEYYQVFLFAVSLLGDQRDQIPPSGCSYFCGGDVTGMSEVSVDGLAGHRYTSVWNTFGITPKGTIQVFYVLYSGQRTYGFDYARPPGQPDRTVDFDRSVQQMLRFSA